MSALEDAIYRYLYIRRRGPIQSLQAMSSRQRASGRAFVGEFRPGKLARWLGGAGNGSGRAGRREQR